MSETMFDAAHGCLRKPHQEPLEKLEERNEEAYLPVGLNILTCDGTGCLGRLEDRWFR